MQVQCMQWHCCWNALSDHATEGRAQLMAPLTGDGRQLSRAVFDLPPITEFVGGVCDKAKHHPVNPTSTRSCHSPTTHSTY